MPNKQLLSIVILVTGFNINSLAANKILKVPNDYLTIQAAIDKAKDGDTVLVEDGVYFGVGNHNISFKGKAITVKSEHGSENTTLLLQSQGGFEFNREDQNSVLDGFTLQKGNPAIKILDSSPKINDCQILSATGNGIHCERNSHPSMEKIGIYNSKEWGLFAYGTARIRLSNAIVDGNLYGIHTGDSNPSVIYNTLITNQIEDGILLNATTTMVNCVVMGNKRGVIIRASNNNATSILNSIIRGNGVAEDDEMENLNNVSDHSIFLYSNIQGIEDGTGNVDVDPKFVDDESGDYRLGSGSPCIDAGSPGPPHKDADGSRNDMGIYGGPHGGKWSNLSQDQTTTSDCNKGDVNADGLIKSIDASLALRLAADLISNPSTEQLCAADI
ncbi:MAG: right-handed parallel beta-helix repeat-containing protein, partial [Candidatus Poribacteria bacterium]|nr:right-handed parallel beta-helix repeat-containing protein [Candidatus Poribacteria bacterium]